MIPMAFRTRYETRILEDTDKLKFCHKVEKLYRNHDPDIEKIQFTVTVINGVPVYNAIVVLSFLEER